MRSPAARGSFALLAGALLFLAAGPRTSADDGTTVAPGTDSETSKIVHLLRRATFGPRPTEVEEVKRVGIENWIDRQLHPETIPDREAEGRLQGFETLGLSTTQYWALIDDRTPAMTVPGAGAPTGPEAAARRLAEINRLRNIGAREVTASVLLRAVYGQRQLQEVMVEFWRNHFNVDLNKDDVRYYLPDWEREVLRKHCFGKFEDFLLATAKHPAMLFYLDNHVSRAPMARGEKVLREREKEDRTDGLNENYARELMELHTLGVDNGYEQKDVIQLALVLTGWSIEGGANRGAFTYQEGYHAKGKKKILDKTVGPGEIDEGEEAIRYLARHKNTRGFVCKKLCRYLVNDEPPQSVLDAATDTWEKTKGDMGQVVRTILLHPDFYARPNVATKAKTPFEFVVSVLRATGADVKDAGQVLERLKDMYQGVYECEDPTGYSDKAVDWMDPGVLAVRWDFARDVLENRVGGVAVGDSVLFDIPRQQPEVWETLLVEYLFAAQPPGLLTLAPFRQRLNEVRRDAQKMRAAERLQAFRTLTTLLLGSPEFQRQ